MNVKRLPETNCKTPMPICKPPKDPAPPTTMWAGCGPELQKQLWKNDLLIALGVWVAALTCIVGRCVFLLSE